MKWLAIALVATLLLAGGSNAQDAETCSVESQAFCEADPDGGKIVGGQEACEHQFPWLAYVECTSAGFRCTGSFIYENWVLTAGHCVDGCTEFRISGGVHDRTDLNAPEVQSFTVPQQQFPDGTWEFLHPDYVTWPEMANDIGLIPLPEPVELNEYVQLSCLPPRGMDNFENLFTTATGWGLIEDNANTNVPFFVRDRRIVLNENIPVYGQAELDDFVCIDTQDGGGMCSGDSGGPLNLQPDQGVYGDGEQYMQVGIASFVAGRVTNRCEAPVPHCFSKVSLYLDFIEERTGIPIP